MGDPNTRISGMAMQQVDAEAVAAAERFSVEAPMAYCWQVRPWRLGAENHQVRGFRAYMPGFDIIGWVLRRLSEQRGG